MPLFRNLLDIVENIAYIEGIHGGSHDKKATYRCRGDHRNHRTA